MGGLSFLGLLLVKQLIVVACGDGSVGIQRGCVGVNLWDLVRL